MKRRNTIDSTSGTWPLCQYYYTHNNGSCDDILLFPKEIAKRRHARKKLLSSSIHKKRRFTYPIVLLDQKSYQQQQRFIHTGKIIRRWSTLHSTKKRHTLANILSSLCTIDNTSKSTHHKTIFEKWESIRLYDNEKTEEPALDPMDPNQSSHTLSNIDPSQSSQMNLGINSGQLDEDSRTDQGRNNHQRQGTPAALIIEIPTATTAVTAATSATSTTCIANHSSIIASPTTSFAGQEIQEHSVIHIEYTTSPEPITPPLSSPKESLVDVFLFLFGFLIFPLWWIGAWFYVSQKQDGVTKSREVFQILNCCMSLVSLILIGLVIGLTTVWT